MEIIIEKTKKGLHVEAEISSISDVESMAKKLAELLPTYNEEHHLLNCSIDMRRGEFISCCSNNSRPKMPRIKINKYLTVDKLSVKQ